FAVTALIAGIIGFFFFLRIAKMPTQVWYFLPLTIFAAVCVDAALANWPGRWQLWRWAFPALMIACLPGARELIAYRQSNMDLVCRLLLEKKKKKTTNYVRLQQTVSKHFHHTVVRDIVRS